MADLKTRDGAEQQKPAYSATLQTLREDFARKLNTFGKSTTGFTIATSATKDRRAFELLFSYHAMMEYGGLEGKSLSLNTYQLGEIGKAKGRVSNAYGKDAVAVVEARGGEYAQAIFGKAYSAAAYDYAEFRKDMKSGTAAAMLKPEKQEVVEKPAAKPVEKAESVKVRAGELSPQAAHSLGQLMFSEVKSDGTLEEVFDKSVAFVSQYVELPAGLKNPYAGGKGGIYAETLYNLKQMENQPNRVDIQEDPRLLVLMAAVSGVAEIKTDKDLARMGGRIEWILPYYTGNMLYEGESYSTEAVMNRGSGVCMDQAALLANVLTAYGQKGTIIELEVNTFVKSGDEFTPVMFLHAIVGTQLPSGEAFYIDATNGVFSDRVEGIVEDIVAGQRIPPELGTKAGTEVVTNAFLPSKLIEKYSPGTVGAIERDLDRLGAGEGSEYLPYVQKFFEGLDRAGRPRGETLKDLQAGYMVVSGRGEIPEGWR